MIFVEVNDTNYINELKQLKELFDMGILSEEEFNLEKRKLLE
ncbi:SHOCT domain-containing protein [Mariniplasma anaerobium]